MKFLSNLFKWLPFGSVAETDAQTLWLAIQQNEIQILDVRTTAEWKKSAISNSCHIPLTQLSHNAINGLNFDKNKPVVAICLSAHRSIPAVRILKEMGFSNVSQLQGGMKAWWKQNLPSR